MKKLITFILALALVLSCAAGASAGLYHEQAQYASDTLTLAGSGFDGVRTLTVAAIEKMAHDESAALGYENEYSMMTSGGVFSTHTFTGVRLYELLLGEGLNADMEDKTPVKLISKDGYTVVMTLGSIRSEKYGRYSSRGGELEEGALPAIVAFASDGERLVGPTGKQSVYTRFEEKDGYVENADNIGGPLRLIVGQTDSQEFNAPNCSKWLSAVVVGDDNGYVYTRETDVSEDPAEPDRTGDWTHRGAQGDYRLKISGTDAAGTFYLSLAELEGMKDALVREYYAASAGRNAYEGAALRLVLAKYLRYGLTEPQKITVKAADGFSKEIPVAAVMQGVDSFYQPGQHRDVLLAWAVDGSPLVPSADSEGYDGKNAYGPLRLVVENTISMWVKSVTEIVLGDETSYADVTEKTEYAAEIADVTVRGIMNGVGGGSFEPEGSLTRAQLVTILWRACGEPVVNYFMRFEDASEGSWYGEAVRWAASQKIVTGYTETSFGPDDSVTREQLGTIAFRCAAANGLDAVELSENLFFDDADDLSEYAVSALNWCVGHDFIEGLADGRLHPGSAATRAQAAAVISRMISAGYITEGTED